jgi:hypothetical protein
MNILLYALFLFTLTVIFLCGVFLTRNHYNKEQYEEPVNESTRVINDITTDLQPILETSDEDLQRELIEYVTDNVENKLDDNAQMHLNKIKKYIDTRVNSMLQTPVIIAGETIEEFEEELNPSNLKNQVIQQINAELKPILDTRDQAVQKAIIEYVNKMVANASLTTSDKSATHAKQLIDQVSGKYDKDMLFKINTLDQKYANDIKDFDSKINNIVRNMIQLSNQKPTESVPLSIYNADRNHFNSKTESLEGKIDGIQNQMSTIIVNAQKISSSPKDQSVQLNSDISGTLKVAGLTSLRDMTIGGYAKFTRDVEVGGNIKMGKGKMCFGADNNICIDESMIRRMTKMADDEAKAKVAKDTAVELAAARTIADKIVADKAAADKIAADKVAAKVSSDKAAADKIVADKAAADKIAADKAAANTNSSQVEFIVPGTYTWTVPSGVSSVSVCIGGGVEGWKRGIITQGQHHHLSAHGVVDKSLRGSRWD